MNTRGTEISDASAILRRSVSLDFHFPFHEHPSNLHSYVKMSLIARKHTLPCLPYARICYGLAQPAEHGMVAFDRWPSQV